MNLPLRIWLSAAVFYLVHTPLLAQFRLSPQLGNTTFIQQVDEQMLKDMIAREFSTIITGQSSNTIGNFASLDLTKAKVDFNGNLFMNDRLILAAKGSGSVAEGLLPIFSDASLNSKVALDLTVHMMMRNYTSIQDGPQMVRYLLKADSLDKAFWLDSLNLVNRRNLMAIEQEWLDLRQRWQRKLDTLIVVNAQLASPGPLGVLEVRQLQNSVRRLSIDTLIISQSLRTVDDNRIVQEHIRIRGNKMLHLINLHTQRINKLKSDLRLSGYKMRWLSFGYKIQNETFRLFDAAVPFDQQVTKHNSTLHEFRAQYAAYRFAPTSLGSYYFALGIALGLSDNLSDLSSSEFTDIKQLGAVPGDRLTTLKYFAYDASEYKEFRYSFRLYSELYWFLDSDNSVAFHLFPEIRTVSQAHWALNNGVGLMVGFRDSEKAGNVVNAEVYANLKDLFNNNDFEDAIFKRSSYGLRFTFPITFKSNL